jgi:integrase
MKMVHRKDGRYEIRIPRKVSASGKRESKYFRTLAEAESFIQAFKAEQREHGRQSISATERRWVGYLRERVGDLSLLPEIVSFWKRSGEHLQPIATNAAVRAYIGFCDAEYSNRRTLADISSRLGRFADHFGARLLHEITVTEIEAWLASVGRGWTRWSYHKRLCPFFQVAKRRRWIANDPMDELPKPGTPPPERRIYTPSEFQTLLRLAQGEEYREMLPFLVLAGFCFLRTSELVKKYREEQVLQWSDLHWQDGLIHVRPGVAKTTRARIDERFTPISTAARELLWPIRREIGDCVTNHSRLWPKLTDEAGIPRIDNGLRHSAISYSLAANPEHGIALTAQWCGSSEAVIRKHYRRLIKPDEAAKWFQARLLVRGPKAAGEAAAKAATWVQEMELLSAKIRTLSPEERQRLESMDDVEFPDEDLNAGDQFSEDAEFPVEASDATQSDEE